MVKIEHTATPMSELSASDTMSLTDLPDPCLLAVLQCVADDHPNSVYGQRSLLNAARAHSRLHQAAVTALHSVKVRLKTQPQMDNVLMYVSRHAQHIDSIDISGESSDYSKPNARVFLRQLPHNLQLTKLRLSRVCVQLQPGGSFPGVLQSLASLKQVDLRSCRLLDTVIAPLQQLPAGLEHLYIGRVLGNSHQYVRFPASALHALQSLTSLQLDAMPLEGPGDEDGTTITSGEDGDEVGDDDGDDVGDEDGSEDGDEDGSKDDSEDGDEVGDEDGSEDGDEDGDEDGGESTVFKDGDEFICEHDAYERWL